MLFRLRTITGLKKMDLKYSVQFYLSNTPFKESDENLKPYFGKSLIPYNAKTKQYEIMDEILYKVGVDYFVLSYAK